MEHNDIRTFRVKLLQRGQLRREVVEHDVHEGVADNTVKPSGNAESLSQSVIGSAYGFATVCWLFVSLLYSTGVLAEAAAWTQPAT